jgi:hypothetical protein
MMMKKIKICNDCSDARKRFKEREENKSISYSEDYINYLSNL